jgi:AcrR family transcriptional regulator
LGKLYFTIFRKGTKNINQLRYKEYNVNRVLEKSIALFWQKGFNGTSINELVDLTGVNRFSLYNEFESKEGILYESLPLYRKRFCQSKLDILKSRGEIEEILKSFYLSFLQDAKAVMGCYVIHVGTELADSDGRVKEFLKDFLDEIESLLKDLLIRHHYSISDASFKARHLTGLYCTTMSFCLIHTPEEREAYTLNGIRLIIKNNA